MFSQIVLWFILSLIPSMIELFATFVYGFLANNWGMGEISNKLDMVRIRTFIP
jgi:hypothetical protein